MGTLTLSVAKPEIALGYSGAVLKLNTPAQVDVRLSTCSQAAGNRLLARALRGEPISGARCVYLHEMGGVVRVYLADAMDADKWAHGFVIEAGPENTPVNVWESGNLPGLSGVSTGGRYYLGHLGTFSTSPPPEASVIQSVGVGKSPTAIAGSIEPPTFVEP